MDIDAQLLDRYARTRDADAFTQLVRRHAGMVFAVARRVTQDHHDAEEIAQSCFMELARQPAAIHGSLPGWLHKVATNRAINFNLSNHRRQRHEQAAARPEALTPANWDDVAPLVDAALAELPENLRLPILLYHLQGLKQYEVAAELGLSPATISHRLEAGVAALREKLKAAGVTVPSVALPALLSQHALEAVPKSLMTTLGRLAVSGFMPAASGALSSGGGAGAASGGTVTASGASSGTAVLGLKVIAAVVLTAAVTVAGVSLLPTRQAIVAVSMGQVSGIFGDAPAMSDELKRIIARVKAETAEGLGDGVTILTFTGIQANNPQPYISRPGTLKLYAQQGESRFYLHYETGRKKDWGNPKARLPAGWPTPGLDETLRFVDQLRTPYLAVTDGHMWWRTQLNDSGTATLLSSRVDEDGQTRPEVWTVAVNYFWPRSADLAAAVSGDRLTSLELVRRPQNPFLAGLHFTFRQDVVGRPDPVLKAEHTFWLDTNRNDVPVEEDLQEFSERGDKLRLIKWVYLDYAQLSDGRWYPIHLQRFGAGGCIDYRIVFFPGKTLDPKWFGDPTSRFAGDTSNATVNTLTKPVVAVSHAITATATTAYRSAWWWPWALAVAVFATATALLIRQRRSPSPAPSLRGAYGPRRR